VEIPTHAAVPGYPAYSPELSYPMRLQTDEAAIVVREQGNSRRVFFPGEIEGTLWRSGHTDLARLLQNAIHWVADPNPPVTIQGDGVVEPFARETAGRFAVHVLNYSNPAMHLGWLRSFHLIGPQKVRMRLTAGRQVSLAATSGVFCGGDVLKLLLAGADVTMLCSVLLRHDIKQVSVIEKELVELMEKHEYESVRQLRGSLSQKKCADPAAFERAQYMRAITTLPAPATEW
jgi:hypothetical protein